MRRTLSAANMCQDRSGCHLYGRAPLAQLVERLLRNEKVTGSIPVGGSE
jgi:hypothetical protein